MILNYSKNKFLSLSGKDIHFTFEKSLSPIIISPKIKFSTDIFALRM